VQQSFSSAVFAMTLLFAPTPGYSDICADLIAAWPNMHHGGTPLVASANNTPYESLYNTCDTRNTFAGKPLPRHNGKPLTCSGDPNHVTHLVKYPDGTISFEAKAAVDADGSQYACGSDWPNQCGTWLQFDPGSTRKDIDAEEASFVVVPTKMPDVGVSFQKDSGIRQGDLAVVVWKDKCSFGVVGDSGPYFRLGEISLRSHAELGHDRCRVPGQRPCQAIRESSIPSGVRYLIFPKSRPSPLTAQNVQQASRIEGEKKLHEFLAHYGR
jgi:hypothetical protein